MPREIVHGDTDRSKFHVAVGWDADHSMQVGIQSVDPEKHLVDHLYGGGDVLPTVGTELLRQIQNAGWKLVLDDESPVGIGPVPTLIGTSSRSGVSEEEAPLVVEAWGNLGTMVLNALHEARPAIERDGVWVTVSRFGANRLVRFIRKARNSAYGADE